MSAEVTACVREFYCLQALEVLAKTDQFRHSHQRWRRDLFEYKSLYTKKLAETMFDYSTLVCFGEMRHGYHKCEYHNPFIPNGCEHSRSSSYETAREYTPISILKSGFDIFGRDWNEDSYGGGAWKLIAEVALNRASGLRGWDIDEVFVDRCVDLSHNGSIYFDKTDADIFYVDSVREYKKYLDFKRYARPEEILRGSFVSLRLYSLVMRAVTLGIIPSMELCHLEFESIEFILNYTPIEWGNSALPNTLLRSPGDDEEDYCDEEEECYEDEERIEEDEEENGDTNQNYYCYKISAVP